MEAIVYLSIGSNLGDRIDNINNAIDELKTIGAVRQVSPFYENPPFGFDAAELFINCCIELETNSSPIELLSQTQTIERSLGRKEKTKAEYESRIIDIDILYYNSEVIELPNLQIPHPKRRERMFVLTPLNDIADNLMDPILNQPVCQLLTQRKTAEQQVLKRITNK